MRKEIVEINGEKIDVYGAKDDMYGNPRYVIHYLALGLKDYESTKRTRSAGLKKYKGKEFGGGFVFQSYNVQASMEKIIDKLSDF